jgi:hypothetical protein
MRLNRSHHRFLVYCHREQGKMSARNQQHRRLPTSTQTTTEDRTTATTTATTTLRLRGEEEYEQHDDVQRPASRRRIRWDESVVNNENMGRKSSKG